MVSFCIRFQVPDLLANHKLCHVTDLQVQVKSRVISLNFKSNQVKSKRAIRVRLESAPRPESAPRFESTRVFVCSSVCLSVCICMSVCLYICLSVCLYVCLFACLYVCLSVYLSVCLYVCMYVSLSILSAFKAPIMTMSEIFFIVEHDDRHHDMTEMPFYLMSTKRN